MTHYLTITVRAHEGRYHGEGDGPPSPFRLFQALVAGAGLSGPLDSSTKAVLSWLERLPAPVVASPRAIRGQVVSVFMPNNDLDAVGGDPRRMGEIRTATKLARPLLFDVGVPWVYAWPINVDDEPQAEAICSLAERLYQLGRGVDMAWAWGELLDDDALEARLAQHGGEVWRPSAGEGRRLACPQPESLKSLDSRYAKKRFHWESGRRVFVQAPKPHFRNVAYESEPTRYLFDIRSSTDPERFLPWPLEAASWLVVCVRDRALSRLRDAAPEQASECEQYLVGRRADGSNAVPSESRVRMLPIPSIGMRYADHGIRRFLVEIPGACPLRVDDVRWAFSGAELFDEETGEVIAVLTPRADDGMLRHYGVESGARVFRTVMPAVLPKTAKRRRVEPTRKLVEAKAGLERAEEVKRACAAVGQALRHAGVRAPVEAVRVQREPFDAAGTRVEHFSEGTRFAKERLWHVEIAFGARITGPLVIGDGRFLGLGVMAPVRDHVPGVHAFAIVDGLMQPAHPVVLTRALRRAVMARVQEELGPSETLPAFFSGHAEDGAPARSDSEPHLAFAFDAASSRLLVLAPHVFERRGPLSGEIALLRTLDEALGGFRELLSGPAGRLCLSTSPVEPSGDAILGRAHEWMTATPYVVTRHAKGMSAAEAIAVDVRAECRRVGLPVPRIESHDVRGVAGLGLTGNVRLAFQTAVPGPILLGRDRYFGGGLFRCAGAR